MILGVGGKVALREEFVGGVHHTPLSVSPLLEVLWNSHFVRRRVGVEGCAPHVTPSSKHAVLLVMSLRAEDAFIHKCSWVVWSPHTAVAVNEHFQRQPGFFFLPQQWQLLFLALKELRLWMVVAMSCASWKYTVMCTEKSADFSAFRI